MTSPAGPVPAPDDRTGALLVHNPVAGGGRDRPTTAVLESLVRARFGRCETIETDRQGQEREVGERLAGERPEAVVVAGGDGTLSLLVDGWMRERRPDDPGPIFVPLRLGSGSDFARGLGTPAEPAAAIRLVDSASVAAADVGRIAFGDSAGHDRFWVNQSYVGLGAAVVARVNRHRGARGQGAYVRATLREVVRWHPVGVEIRGFPEAPGPFALTNLLVTNGPYSGSGMFTSPHADPTDHRWEVVAVGPVPRLRLVRELGRFRTGTHLGRPGVNLWHATRLDLAVTEPGIVVPVEADGDVVGALPATYELIPGAIRVPRFVPTP